MKRIYVVMIFFIGLTLAACTTHNPPLTPTKTKPISSNKTLGQNNIISSPHKFKNPIAVALYSKGTHPEHPYKVIAKKSISKYNPVGIKRQEAVIHDALRNIAASIGGDAVINITKDEKKVTCEVVTFQDKGWG